MAHPPPPSASTASLLVSKRHSINELQQQLQHCYQTGDCDRAASIAQELTRLTQEIKQMEQTQHEEAQRYQQAKQQTDLILTQLNDIKSAVRHIDNNVKSLRHRLSRYLRQPSNETFPFNTNQQQQQQQYNSKSTGFFSSVAASLSSNQPSQPRFDHSTDLISKLRKSIHESQILFEREILKLDNLDLSIDTNSACDADLLVSFKVMRKDCITMVQQNLQQVDEFEKHVVAFAKLVDFVNQPTQQQQ